jgi:hypothetical protein
MPTDLVGAITGASVIHLFFAHMARESGTATRAAAARQQADVVAAEISCAASIPVGP